MGLYCESKYKSVCSRCNKDKGEECVSCTSDNINTYNCCDSKSSSTCTCMNKEGDCKPYQFIDKNPPVKKCDYEYFPCCGYDEKLEDITADSTGNCNYCAYDKLGNLTSGKYKNTNPYDPQFGECSDQPAPGWRTCE